MKCKLAAAIILNFCQVAFLVAIQRAILYFPTKLERYPSTLGEVMAIIPKSNMATVRHFGILTSSLKTTLIEYLVMSCVCANFIRIP